jgi:Ser/Thr protein kinase RdoA (MazF antagonist)
MNPRHAERMETAEAFERFRVQAADGDRLESRSGAGVHRVRTEDGTAAYLKLISGPEARRELTFYTHVAPAVPVRTPRLLNSAATSDGVALLLEDAGTPRPVGQWTSDDWATLGRDLAALHRMPIPQGLPALDGTRSDLAAAEAFWAATLPRELLDRLDELDRHRTALPPAFVHGDCHTENIVVGEDGLVFCDWQLSGTGTPSSDLAFPSIRATPAGVTVTPALLDAYLEGADAHRRRTVGLATLAAELWVFVLLWPPFAAYNTPTGIDRVRRRTRLLADRWLAAASL